MTKFLSKLHIQFKSKSLCIKTCVKKCISFKINLVLNNMHTDSKKAACSFDSCPEEIYIIIFKYLSAKDLLTCRAVNKTWRILADYCGQHQNRWMALLKERMHNRGVTFQQRSNLDNKDLYLNSCMWKYVCTAQAHLEHVYDIKEAQKINVYKDNLIVVCKDSVKFINLEQGKIIKEIPGEYLDYQETDFLIARVTLKDGKKHMSLYCKLHDKTYESPGFKMYSIQNNKCYISNAKSCMVMYVCTPTHFNELILGRFYGNPNLLRAIFMYEDDMYLYVANGNIFHHRKGDLGLTLVCTSEVPTPPGILTNTPSDPFKAMFHKYSTVFTVKTKKEAGMIKNVDTYTRKEHLILLFVDLTCATEHGEVLLLGFKDGKVEIIIVSRYWTCADLKADFSFYIQDVAQVAEVEPIRSLEVYEGEGCHHILVMTSKLYQVVISHADYKKVMP